MNDNLDSRWFPANSVCSYVHSHKPAHPSDSHFNRCGEWLPFEDLMKHMKVSCVKRPFPPVKCRLGCGEEFHGGLHRMLQVCICPCVADKRRERVDSDFGRLIRFRLVRSVPWVKEVTKRASCTSELLG